MSTRTAKASTTTQAGINEEGIERIDQVVYDDEEEQVTDADEETDEAEDNLASAPEGPSKPERLPAAIEDDAEVIPPPTPATPTLEELTASVRLYFPVIQEAMAARMIASGETLAAWGAYDHKLEGNSTSQPLDYYENYWHGLGLKRDTYWGGQTFAGYRVGRGDFEPWYRERETNDGGEFKAGFMTPLAKDRTIDLNRAELWRAELERGRVEPEIRALVLLSVRDATAAYWEWVAAAAMHEVARGVLELGLGRMGFLERQVELGEIASIDLTDNRRIIVSRQAALVDARRKLEQSAVKLSLYLRDQTGRPVVLPRDAGLRLVKTHRSDTLVNESWDSTGKPSMIAFSEASESNLHLQRLQEVCLQTDVPISWVVFADDDPVMLRRLAGALQREFAVILPIPQALWEADGALLKDAILWLIGEKGSCNLVLVGNSAAGAPVSVPFVAGQSVRLETTQDLFTQVQRAQSLTPVTSGAIAPALSTTAVRPVEKDLLRFITCGSVDDGKSTLIGRLMLDAGAVYSDQIAALQLESEKHGTNGGEIDTALLLDGLEDERQQGITIDVAYRYFATEKRKFIIADTPGHEQFTRNMATGASTADLAILLVDATKGVLTQTKRHAFIVSLLGIKHVILAVNKMDLVDYDEATFDAIRGDFQRFASKLDVMDLRFVPLSARHGDNVAEPSAKMHWYADGSLLHQLETIYVGADQNLRDFRLPVQWVNRPDNVFRGFSGTIASGAVRVGDEIIVLPSGKRSRVRSIVTMDATLDEAAAPRSVTLTLEDEIDVTRGDYLCRPGNQPHVARAGEAMLVWMSESPLNLGRPLWFKNAAGRAVCEVESIRYEVDVNTLHRKQSDTLRLNAIGRCSLGFHQPIAYDAYDRNRKTGAFILVDRITHETLAAGMFLDHGMSGDPSASPSSFLPAQRVESPIEDSHRLQRYGHEPFTVLLTGLPASGKTTIAKHLEQSLFGRGAVGVLLDGESLRHGISKGLGFSKEERSENLRRGAEIAKLLNESGQFCIAAFCAPEEAMRQKFCEIVGRHRVVHVHLDASVAACRLRDTTGRYLAADRGEIDSFPGVSANYEVPTTPDLTIVTEEGIDVEVAVRKLIDRLGAGICKGGGSVAIGKF